MGGANATLGAVQVCMNNAWGLVCNNRFGTNDASVVCGELGFPTTGATSFRDASSRFNISSGPIFLDNVRCSESIKKLIDCPLGGGSSFGRSECDNTQLAGVQCVGK